MKFSWLPKDAAARRLLGLAILLTAPVLVGWSAWESWFLALLVLGLVAIGLSLLGDSLRQALDEKDRALEDRDRVLTLWRQVFLDLYALPPGILPSDLQDAVEDVVAPVCRERREAAFLVRLPLPGKGN